MKAGSCHAERLYQMATANSSEGVQQSIYLWKMIMVTTKKFKVPDIQPGFIIEVLDNEQKPIAGIKFSVSFEDGNAKIIETDEDGILTVLPKPKSEIKLSLAGEGEESGKTLEEKEKSSLLPSPEMVSEFKESQPSSKEPYEYKVPFAEQPPAGCYWPVMTSRNEGRRVAFRATDRSLEGQGDRRFLADRPVRGGDRYHLGIDLFADENDPVIACEKGKIVNFHPYCCEPNYKTWALLVEHSGVVINYGEVAPDSLKKLKLIKGKSIVEAGAIIGYVGKNPSGKTMLHFETYKKGTTKTGKWLKSEKKPPKNLLDPTKYLLFLKEQGLSAPEKQKKSKETISGYTEYEASPENTVLSGKGWVSKFPTSISVEDLDSAFTDKIKKFISSLEDAGAKVTINATKRPQERAYLMHWSWKIVKENHDARKIPPYKGVNINWWHDNQSKSKVKAQEMVNSYGINNLKVAPSLQSYHIKGKAIDMTISWVGDMNIKKKDGSKVTITTLPRDGTNSKLIEVGATYGVIHFKNAQKDKPHWSTNGK